jgi:hypothetical protein
MNNIFTNALDNTINLIDDYFFMINYRKNLVDFSRERKMTFKNLILYMLNNSKKSSQIEIQNYFDNFIEIEEVMSKQAYSQARLKIKYEAFEALNYNIMDTIYVTNRYAKFWDEYRISAIDGSILEIPNTEILRGIFGFSKNKSREVARAKSLCILDINNNIILNSSIEHYKTSERKMAMDLIKKLPVYPAIKDLILFDRGFPSAEMVAFLSENSKDYVMRVSKTFSKSILNATESEQIIMMYHNSKAYPVRVVRFLLDSGEEEILITSLIHNKITLEEFKTLYFMRWGIEVKFNGLKNRFEIDNFSGNSEETIKQDFHAIIFLSNMCELAKSVSDEEIKAENSTKKLKHEYKTNLNNLIGVMKDSFICLLLEDNKTRRNRLLKALFKHITRSRVPTRNNRKNPRKVNKGVGKYPTNRKRAV